MPTLKDKAVRHLARHVEEMLSKQNEKGEFWPDAGFLAPYPTDYQQFAFYALAYLYTLDHAENPWKGNARLLQAVERSFRNNLALEDEHGGFLSSSHDQPFSTHHANNWRSFTWLRAWELLRGQIDPKLERACEDGLRRTLPCIWGEAKRQTQEKRFGENHNVRNHPVWYFLATYALGKQFGDQAAMAWAAETFERVCACQHPAGVWFEHDGPVVVYHHISMNGLSHFHALTQAASARAALERSLGFCRLFTYPSGHPVEILDGRTRYTGYVVSILPALWAQIPEGRALLHFLLDKLLEQPLGGGYQVHGGWLGLPFFTQFARDLPEDEPPPAPGVHALVGEGNHAPKDFPVRLIRKGPWTVALSGFTRPELPLQRWCLDYQTHCAIFHEKAGLIVGGGGGKRQAYWSLFSGGARPLGLPSLATEGTVEARGANAATLRLNYPGFRARLDAEVRADEVVLTARVDKPDSGAAAPSPVYLQLPFPMKGEAPVVDGRGGQYVADLQDEILPEALGGAIGRAGKFMLHGFDGARALLHMLPYNTHWRDGRAPREKAMGVVAQPLAYGVERTVTVRV
ncbi:MAG: hypothetical protein HY291_20315 [Planctomycetes bacterium]|nr:hypothetical protein [Planctomycetota bacterium]